MEQFVDSLPGMLAIGGAAATSVWAAYQNWDEQPSWKKALMVLGPIAMLGIVLAIIT